MSSVSSSAQLPSSLSDLKLIRQNQRFACYKATYESHSVFVKQVRHPELSTALSDEQWGMQTFARLQTISQLPFAVPEVLFGRVLRCD
jgi:hypothetical protein